MCVGCSASIGHLHENGTVIAAAEPIIGPITQPMNTSLPGRSFSALRHVPWRRWLQALCPPIFLSLLCWLAAGINYLLFHTLAEMLSIVVAVAAMVVASTSQRFVHSHFVVFISLAVGWCAGLDLLHTLTFKGMHLLPGDSANPATQLWIAARLLQALALLLSPLLLHRQIHVGWTHTFMGATAAGVVIAIGTGYFPAAYIDGQGLTPFKIYTEYLIITLLGLALFLFWRNRQHMSGLLFYSMSTATVMMMASEFAFTQYVSVYAQSNLVGHLLKIFSYWFVFLALVRATVREPFVRLQQEVHTRERLAAERAALVRDLGERIKELRCLYALSELIEQPQLTCPELMQGAARLLPPAFSWPEHALARVTSEWGEFGAATPKTTPRELLSTPIVVNGRELGLIEVWYGEKAPERDEHFLPEERSLVHNVARHLGEAVQRMQSTEKVQRLQYLYEMLSATNRAVVRSQSRAELLQGLFQALLAHGTFPKLFLALADEAPWPLHLWQHSGFASEQEPQLRDVLSRTDSPLHATLAALTEGQVVWESLAAASVPLYQQPDQALAHGTAYWTGWSHHLVSQGITQRAVMPLRCQGRLIGVVGLYAAGITTFDEEQLRLLHEMAGDMEFALNHLTAEEQLRETEEKAELLELRFQEVFRASPVPMQIMALREQRMRAINDAHTQWLGYQIEDIPDEDTWFRKAYHDEGQRQQLRAHWRQSVEQVRNSGQEVQSPEMILYCKDGSQRTTRGTMTVVGDDAIIAWMDLTEIRRNEQVLRESERRFRGMVEQAVSGMYVRRDGRFIYVNPRYCEMIGWSAQDLLGQDVFGFTTTDPDNLAQIKAAWAQLHSGECDSVTYSVPLLCKDGHFIEVGLTAKLIVWDDGLPATIVMAQDITEQKRSQEQIAAYVKQLEGSMRGTLQAVSNMVEMRDPYTAGHERRVGLIASAIAKEMGWSPERCEQLELLGLVHDIGKIAVPSEILTKPTRLSKLEMELMKGHAQAGYDILKDVPFPSPVAEIIRQHHERLDGSGYPQGLKGEDILPEARVLAVADVIESMASHRPYRAAVGLDAALAEVVNHRGSLYAPEVVDAAVRLVQDKQYVLPG